MKRFKLGETTPFGILKGAVIGATIGVIIGLPLGNYLTRDQMAETEHIIHNGAKDSLRYIAIYTAKDPQEFDIGVDPETGQAKAAYYMKEYALPEQFKKDFELSDINTTVLILDKAPLYKEVLRFGLEDTLIIRAYDDSGHVDVSFSELDYERIKVHDSSGPTFMDESVLNEETLDRVILGVLNTIFNDEMKKKMIYA